MDSNDSMSRRSFVGALGSATGGLYAFTIVPRHVLGGPGFVAPSDMVNVALVGAATWRAFRGRVPARYGGAA